MKELKRWPRGLLFTALILLCIGMSINPSSIQGGRADTASEMASGPKTIDNGPSRNGAGAEPTTPAEGGPVVDGLKYLAIGPSGFRETMRPLIEWKTRKGVVAYYAELDGKDGVLNNSLGKGRDEQELIRDYINHMWRYTNPELKWVLLVGDGEIIPSRRVFVNGTVENDPGYEYNWLMTDYYYAGLDGSWDTNGNGVFGEEWEQDFYAEVYVGRFPASNVEELETMVSRQLIYETDPPPGSWTGSTLLAGSLMDVPNKLDNLSTPLIDEGYAYYKDNAFELVNKVADVVPEDVTPFMLYDYPQVEFGGYSQLFDTLNASTFQSHFEAGFSTVMVGCHGDENGNCTDYKGDGGGALPFWLDYEVYFDYETGETIGNGNRVPLVYISNCDSLNFSEEDDTNMERLLRNREGGAIGVIGASTTTYRGEFRENESSWGNWWLAQKYFDILFHRTPHPGEALYLQKGAYDTYILQNWEYEVPIYRMFWIDNLAYNLLGDPEGQIWIGEPKRFEMVEGALYDQYSETFSARFIDSGTGEPVKGALVTLSSSDDPELYMNRTTDQNGRLEIPLVRHSLEPFIATITKDGYVPLVNDIEVTSKRNIGLLPGVVLSPELPTENRQFTAEFTIRNTGQVNLTNVRLNVEIRGPQPDEREVLNPILVSPLNRDRNRVIPVSLTPFPGRNRLVARVSLVYDPSRPVIEVDDSDNEVVLEFTANRPPEMPFPFSLTTIEDKMRSELYDPLNLSRYVYDEDRGPGELNFDVRDIEGGFDVVIEGGFLDLVPHENWNGPGSFTLVVSDGAYNITSYVDVEVTPDPDPPEFDLFPDSVEAEEDVPVNFSVGIEDVDSNILSLISSTPYVKIEKISNTTGLFNVTVNVGQEYVGRTNWISLVAKDENNQSTEKLIKLTVSPTNDPPNVTAPALLNGTSGKSVKVELLIEDEDGDSEFTIAVSYEFGEFTTNRSVFMLDIPGSVKRGTYTVTVEIGDNNGGNRTVTFDLVVEESGSSGINPYLIVIILIVLVLIVSYGAFIKIQEKKQKELVEKVGTDKPLEARAITPETFDEGSRAPIMAPPVPLQLEGTMARKMKEEALEPDDDYDQVAPSEMDEELEDLASEMFGGDEGDA